MASITKVDQFLDFVKTFLIFINNDKKPHVHLDQKINDIISFSQQMVDMTYKWEVHSKFCSVYIKKIKEIIQTCSKVVYYRQNKQTINDLFKRLNVNMCNGITVSGSRCKKILVFTCNIEKDVFYNKHVCKLHLQSKKKKIAIAILCIKNCMNQNVSINVMQQILHVLLQKELW
ncbi:MAG: hypothetical protein ACW98X_12125 [Promethearchaeota archaeon]|jgi:hypothetical protein